MKKSYKSQDASHKLKKEKGFTLLELLVSISIIGVLISLAAVSYSSAQKKARDAKRQGDLKAIQNAMEQYYSSCGYVYPATLPAVDASLTCASPVLTFLDKMPSDPKTGDAYVCSPACDATGYTIWANGSEIIPTPYVKNLQ